MRRSCAWLRQALVRRTWTQQHHRHRRHWCHRLAASVSSTRREGASQACPAGSYPVWALLLRASGRRSRRSDGECWECVCWERWPQFLAFPVGLDWKSHPWWIKCATVKVGPLDVTPIHGLLGRLLVKFWSPEVSATPMPSQTALFARTPRGLRAWPRTPLRWLTSCACSRLVSARRPRRDEYSHSHHATQRS